MAFITTDELRTRLAATLRMAADANVDEDSPWQQILEDAAGDAYLQIVGALRKRGYTKAQIDTWARGAEFSRDLGIYWCLTRGAGIHGYDDKFLLKLDRRLELDTVDLLDSSGEIIVPANATGLIGHGELSTANDLFSMDPHDDRIGSVTQW